MQVEAIYDHGRLELIPPLRLKQERMRLVVIVPENGVEPRVPRDVPADIIENARAMLARLEAIKNAPPEEDVPEITEKQMERIGAFGLYDEIKGLR